MIRSARSAWVALRRPAVSLSTVVASALFAALATVLTFGAADDGTSNAAPGPGLEGVTKATLARADGLVAGLGNAVTFLGVVSVVVGATAVAADFQHGTLRTLLVRQPNRLRLLAGKLLAVGGLLGASAAIAAAAAVLTALAVAGGMGVDSGGWTVGEALLAALRTAAAMAGFGLFGATLGFVLRSPVAAVGAGAAWLLAVELLLVQASDAAESVLPGQLLTAIADGSADLAQVTVAGAWVLGAVGVSTTLAARRDVTA